MSEHSQKRTIEFPFPTMEILGTKIHKATLREGLHALEMLTLDGGPHMVVTLNTEMVMRAHRDEQFRNVINNASLILPDAVGLVWGSMILGNKLSERLPGVDTVQNLVRIAAEKGFRLFLLGAAPGVAEQVRSILQQRYPGLIVSGTYSGSSDPRDDEETCRIINSAEPDILLVAYKVPEQEFWIARNLHRLHVAVVINVGGTFDFIAGVTKRAPAWMRKAGLEWLHRLVQQPHRWRRQLVLPQFALKVLLYRLKQTVRLK